MLIILTHGCLQALARAVICQIKVPVGSRFILRHQAQSHLFNFHLEITTRMSDHSHMLQYGEPEQ